MTVVGKLEESDGKQVLEYMRRKNSNCPFEAHESYYCRSSHCGIDFFLSYLHDLNVYRVPHIRKSYPIDTEAYQRVAVDLELYFVIGFALSAVHSTLMLPASIACYDKDKHKCWFHNPYWGGWITIDDVWTGDCLVGFELVRSGGMQGHPPAAQAHEAYRRVYEKFSSHEFFSEAFGHAASGATIALISEKTLGFREELEQLHGELKRILEKLVQKIEERC